MGYISRRTCTHSSLEGWLGEGGLVNIGDSLLSLIGIYELWGMDLVSWFPGVICFRVSYPFDQVLEGSSPPEAPMINDPFDLVFFFSFNKVRGWPQVVGSVCARFMIGG